jgi:transposase
MKRKIYSSDLTDEEWILLSEFIPPVKHGGRPRSTDIREVLTLSFTCCEPVVLGDYCRTIFHAGRRFIITGERGAYQVCGSEQMQFWRRFVNCRRRSAMSWF